MPRAVESNIVKSGIEAANVMSETTNAAMRTVRGLEDGRSKIRIAPTVGKNVTKVRMGTPRIAKEFIGAPGSRSRPPLPA
jgi:hypothetical protein